MKTTASNPLADVNTVADLETKINMAKAVNVWCERNPTGGTVQNDAGEDIKVDADMVRQMLAEAEEIITIHGPARLRYLNEVEEHEKHARRVYPEIFKRGSSMWQKFQAMLQACPELMRFPDYQLILGDCITGMQSRLSRN